MPELTTELLMAYADDQLDPERRSQVEAALDDDAGARELVRRFRADRQALHREMDQVLNEPVPRHLIDLLQRDPPTKSPWARFRDWITGGEVAVWPRLAIASFTALVVGVLFGSLMSGDPAGEPLPRAGADLLGRALETRASGTPLSSEDGVATVTPLATFRSGEGRFCREYERSGPGGAWLGIACREAGGEWTGQIELRRSLLAGDQVPSGYAPASGAADPMSTVLDRLAAGAALGSQQERDLMERGWE